MMAGGAGRLRQRRLLLAVVIGGAALEVAVLQAAGLDAVAMGPQVTAPPPFGVLHDLRWLLVYHHTWWAFAVGAAALLVLRGMTIAVLLRAAWPSGTPAPTLAQAFRRGVGFTAAAAVLLSPWVALQFGMAVAPISWLFFVAVPAVVVLALLLHHGPAAGGWWCHRPQLRTAGWTALSFVVLTAGGAAISLAPAVLVVPAAAACGLWSAWAWCGITHAAASTDRPARRISLAPAGVAAFVAVAAAGTAIGFDVNDDRAEVRAIPPATSATGGPVLVVAGFGSDWSGQVQNQLPGPVDEHRYSYRGLGDAGPLPYGPADTHRSLTELVRSMDDQVKRLSRRSSVAIVAASEGSVVAQAYLASHPDAPVHSLVLLSPLLDPGRVWYPPEGSEGWGVAAGWQLRAVTAVIRGLSPLTITPDAPLLRSLMELAPALRAATSCSFAGVRQLVVVPLADAVVAGAAPAAPDEAGARVVVPAFHGGLLGDDDVADLVGRFVAGEAVGEPASWDFGERAVRAAASAWQVPSLATSLHPGWDGGERATCNGARTALADAIERSR